MNDSASCSSSSSSSESENSLNPPPDEPRPGTSSGNNRKRKVSDNDKAVKGGKRKKSCNELRKFAQECFQQFMSVNNFPNYPTYRAPLYEQENEDVVSLNASGELFSDNDDAPPNESCPNVELPLNTVLKEPTISKSIKAHVDLLNSIQHLNTPEWNNVRYADVQKCYSSTPGFTELECNDEVKPFDRFPNLIVSERSYAAFTQALLKQRDATQNGLQSLLKWASETGDLSPLTLKDKVNEIFIEGPYSKISSDLLQLSCGHRADIIEQRRDGILRFVKDKFVRSNLRKIPPTSESLFNKESLSSTVEKAGGVNKIFWPTRSTSQKTNWPAAQAGPSHPKPPAQGYHDLSRSHYSRQTYTPAPPAQGTYPTYFPPQGIPVPMYYPQQGFSQSFQGQRFAQNQNNRLNRPDNRVSRQKPKYEDGHGKAQSKNMQYNNPKTFRPKRKF